MPSSTSWIDDDVGRVHPGQPVDQRQRALEARARRAGAGRHDDLVGTDGRDGRRAHLLAEPDLDAERRPGCRSYQSSRSSDLAARRLEPGEAELAAQPADRLDERHVMAALGRDARSLEPGRSAADDQDASAGRRLGSNRSPPHSNSRPADGLTRHEIQ